MVLSATEEVAVAKDKHKLRLEFENLRHKNEMEELAKKLEIANAMGGTTITNM